MIKKYIKASLLVLFMASSITLTSCKKDEAPAPDTTEQDAKDKAEQDAKDKAEQDAKDKAEQDAKDKAEKEEKARVEKALIGSWENVKYAEDPNLEGLMGYTFKEDGSIQLYEYIAHANQRFVLEGTYTVSNDGKQFTFVIPAMGNKPEIKDTIDIKEVTDKVLKSKGSVGEFDFKAVDYFSWS